MEQNLPYPPQQSPQARPKNWLVESILVTIFCCMPFGIAGIVFASQVNSRYALGDYAGSLKASRDARKWTIVSFIVGGGFALIMIILGIVSSVFFGGWHNMQGVNMFGR